LAIAYQPEDRLEDLAGGSRTRLRKESDVVAQRLRIGLLMQRERPLLRKNALHTDFLHWHLAVD
jgi:hypothetical protein